MANQQKPNLFIHTGTHKTGTTAIQRFLKANNQIFASKGFGIAGLSTSERSSIRQIALAYNSQQKINKIDPDNDPIAESISRCRKKHNQTLNSFVISWEGFSGDHLNGYLDNKYFAKFISQYKSKFNIKTITFFRRQDSFIESAYTQKVKHGYTQTFNHYLKNVDISGFNWLSMAKNYEAELGRENTIISRFGKEYFQDKTSILKEFIGYLGLTPDEFDFSASNKAFIISNPGWPRNIVEVTRELNPRIPQHQRRNYIRAIEAFMHKDPQKGYSYLTDFQRQELTLKFYNSNLQLANERFANETQELFYGELKSTREPIKPIDRNNEYNLDREALLNLILEFALNLEENNNISKQQIVAPSKSRLIAYILKSTKELLARIKHSSRSPRQKHSKK